MAQVMRNRGAGRPRKEGQRYASGRLIPPRGPDHGAPQLKKKRQQLVVAPGDFRAGSALGVLAEQDKITAEQYPLGEAYAELFFPAAHPPTGSALSHLGDNAEGAH